MWHTINKKREEISKQRGKDKDQDLATKKNNKDKINLFQKERYKKLAQCRDVRGYKWWKEIIYNNRKVIECEIKFL